jgi:hypothetical protein
MSISTISGYAAFARARIGSDGDQFGDPECFAGVSDSNCSTGRKTWCADPSTAFDSGWVSIVWTATTAGGSGSIQFQVTGCSPATISCAGTQGGGIDSVKIRAAVTGANRRASFRNVVAGFYSAPTDTTPAEEIILASTQAPVASTMGGTDPIDAEVIRLVQPDGSEYGKVRLTADIRFEATDPGLPSEDALFADMFAFT